MTTAHTRTDAAPDLRVADAGDLNQVGTGDLAQLAEELDRLDRAELRRLSADGLAALADRIRKFLVLAVSATGGHLGSNLGVVELTLALHRVFDSPRDQLVWDTGHQAYVHKALTGRASSFGRLRQAGGLSGYPNRAESAHDLVENSHASTGLSYAYGLARAHKLLDETRRVVCVVGDGALTGGLAYEALNNIGTSKTPVVVVLNDNGRSYSPTVSTLTTAGRAAPGDTTGSSSTRAFVESLGIAYEGPIDGHDIESLERALLKVDCHTGPVLVHVHTVKGRGYQPAEQDEDKCLHDVAPFDPATGLVRPRAGAALELHPSIRLRPRARGGATPLTDGRDRRNGRSHRDAALR